MTWQTATREEYHFVNNILVKKRVVLLRELDELEAWWFLREVSGPGNAHPNAKRSDDFVIEVVPFTGGA